MTMTTARKQLARMAGLVAMVGLVLAASALLRPAGAQEGAEAQEQEPPVRPQTNLVFEREVFTYPSFERRNPFGTLLANSEGAPRFEQMRLEGIVFSEHPGMSLVVLSAGRRGTSAPAPGTVVGQTRRLRAGERWGNVRVVTIRRTEVVVEVEEFGITERRTMELPTRGQGGSR
jgi:hypothetical protein